MRLCFHRLHGHERLGAVFVNGIAMAHVRSMRTALVDSRNPCSFVSQKLSVMSEFRHRVLFFHSFANDVHE